MTQPVRKWAGLAALIPGLAMAFMDQTILPVALPTIQLEFGASNVALQWTVNAYLLATAIIVLAAGKWSDRIGHFRIFISGMSLFALSSLFCGLSGNIGWLIVFRSVQGIGAALMGPSQTALLAALFPPQQRGKATGLFVSISSFFLIIAPLIGGYLTETWTWRGIFWINIPIAIVGIVLAWKYLPRTEPVPVKIDLLSCTIFGIGIAGIILFLMEGREWGWLAAETWICLSVMVLASLLSCFRERSSPHPFLDLALFKHPVFTAINISVGIVQFILMMTVFRSIYFQEVLAYSPAQAGLLTFFSTLPVLFLSTLGGYLSDRFSPKIPIAIGYVLLIFSFALFALAPAPTFPILLLGLLPFGMGVSLVFTPSYSHALNTVPKAKLGIAMGTLATTRTFSATLGVALIGAFIDAVEESYFQKHAAGLPPAEIKAIANGSMVPPEMFKSTMIEARILGFSLSHWLLTVLLLIAFAAAMTLYRRKSTHGLPEMPAEGYD